MIYNHRGSAIRKGNGDKIRILIDGYNVTGVNRGNLEAVRKALIRDLIEYRKKTGHSITVVFDGWRDGAGHESRTVSGGVTVMFSGIGERADDLIKRIASAERGKWVIVSSDRDIESFAWRSGCVPIMADVFLHALDRSLEDDEYSTEDEMKVPPDTRRKRSKRQKEIMRVISKL